MSQPGNTYLERKLAHLCTRCGEPAADDAELCTPHLDDARARARLWARKRRSELRRKGRCIDCGRKSKLRRCPRCYRRTRGVDTDSKGVDNTAPHWRTESDARPDRQGQTTQRYVGKSRRGRLTREQQIDEDKRDLRHAIEYLEEGIRRLEAYKQSLAQVVELPLVQRQAARRVVADPAGAASRIVDDFLDRYT